MAEDSEFVIFGYLSLALKILTISEHESNRIRKKLDGFNAKMHGIPIQDFPVYLIAYRTAGEIHGIPILIFPEVNCYSVPLM